MHLNQKGTSVFTDQDEFEFWWDADRSIHLIIKGDPSGHVVIN